MKNLRKILSALIALVMVFTLATPVFAVNTEENPNNTAHTIVIKNENNNHEYQAYQVFSGDYVDGKLTNITWGKGVDSAALLAALQADEYFGTKFDACVTAEDVAGALAGMDSEGMDKFSSIVAANLSKTYTTSAYDATAKQYNIAVIGDGYYFIKDKDGSQAGQHDAYTDYIIQVVGTVVMNPKSTFPTVDKLVWDEEADAEAGHNKGWKETADHHINESFEFKLIANLPAKKVYDETIDGQNYNAYNDYKNYKVIFTDTMSASITFERLVSVKVDGKLLEANEYNLKGVAEGDAGKTWTITIENINKMTGINLADGADIEVIYKAHLNESAQIGNVLSNNNKVYLEYSNNPNVDAELGKTPEDTVWVFTYQIDLTKIDGATKDSETKTTLAGAQFTLKDKATNKYVVVDPATGIVKNWSDEVVRPVEGSTSTLTSVLTSDENGKIYIIGLDHGKYELEEIVAPTGYNLLKGTIEVTINAVHNEIDAEHAQTKNGEHVPNVELTVNNFAGATLPETGGIGTTLFYIIGGLLAVGAVVLLVTKKRVDA